MLKERIVSASNGQDCSMKIDLDSEAIFFMHVQKTAGQSVSALLESNIPREKSFFSSWPVAVQRRDSLAPYALFRGHLFYNFRKLIPRPVHVVAFFREPAARLYSEYLYIQRTPGHGRYERVSKMRFEEFLANRRHLNIYSRFLTFFPKKAPDGSVDFSNMVPMKSGTRMLSIAKQRIDGMAFVGITEHFDESVARMCDVFGWPAPERAPAVNIAPPQEAAEIARNVALARAAIEAHAPLEFEIYQHAEARFRSGNA